jgi:ribosomal-protein-alanine N-acetyltransferase
VIAIEPMRWWHLDDVQALEVGLFPSDPWTPDQFWQELAQDTREYVVALSGDRVVGYAGAFVLPPDSDVQTIAVSPDQQGTGLGGRLLDALMDVGRRAGCTHMMLEVRADNTSAASLYERRGFAVISTRPRYYPDGVDARVMRCDLRSSAPMESA